MSRFIPFGNQMPINSRWGIDTHLNNKAATKDFKFHPGYEHITYELNSHGYRCPEFSEKGDIKIVTVGCSESFGYGVTLKNRFSYLLCKKIEKTTNKKTIDFNIALPTRSNDYCSRILLSAVPFFKPDIVVVCFPRFNRREYIDFNENMVNYLGDLSLKNVLPQFHDPWSYLSKLGNCHEDYLNFFKNYKIIEANVPNFIFSTMETEFQQVSEIFNKKNFIGIFPNVDVAVDGKHRGIKSHEKMAAVLFDYIKKNNPQIFYKKLYL